MASRECTGLRHAAEVLSSHQATDPGYTTLFTLCLLKDQISRHSALALPFTQAKLYTQFIPPFPCWCCRLPNISTTLSVPCLVFTHIFIPSSIYFTSQFTCHFYKFVFPSLSFPFLTLCPIPPPPSTSVPRPLHLLKPCTNGQHTTRTTAV